MKVIKSTRIVYCDVDKTLIWSPSELPSTGTEDMFYEVKIGDNIFFGYWPHDQLLQEFKARGHTIVVWSQGGWKWAEQVVRAMELDHIVDLVIDKPDFYIDDKDVAVWMIGRRTFIEPSAGSEHCP